MGGMTRRGVLLTCIILAIVFFNGLELRRAASSFAERVLYMGTGAECAALTAENASLKAFMTLSAAPSSTPSLLFSNVYVAYPFADARMITIDKGSAEGVRPRMPATVGGTVLIGQVQEARKHHSTVRLVGSVDWNIAVRIGTDQVPGLLVGGTVPRITMIPADRRVSAGDRVTAAHQGLPYGMTLGTIASVMVDEARIFQEALITLDYDLASLASVALLQWIPD
jgi:cell shape-determining protein MreC